MVLSIHTPVKYEILHSTFSSVFDISICQVYSFYEHLMVYHCAFIYIFWWLIRCLSVCLLEICFLLKCLLLSFPFSMNRLFFFFLFCNYFIYSLVSCKYFPLHGFFILNGVFEDQKFFILCYAFYHCFSSWQGLFESYLRNLFHILRFWRYFSK